MTHVTNDPIPTWTATGGTRPNKLSSSKFNHIAFRSETLINLRFHKVFWSLRLIERMREHAELTCKRSCHTTHARAAIQVGIPQVAIRSNLTIMRSKATPRALWLDEICTRSTSQYAASRSNTKHIYRGTSPARKRTPLGP